MATSRSSRGVFAANVRTALSLLPAAQRWRWAATVPLGLAAAVVESLSAACVFALVAAISDPASLPDLAIVSVLYAAVPADWRTPADIARVFFAATGVLLVARLLVSIGITYYRQRVVARDRVELGIELFHGYLAAPYAFHLRRDASDYVHRINTGLAVVFETVLAGLATMVNTTVTAAALLAVLFVASPTVTVVGAVVLAVWAAAVGGVLGGRSLAVGRETEAVDVEANRALWHALAAMPEIQALGRERAFRDAYARTKERSVDLLLRRAWLELAPRWALEALFVGAMLLFVALTLGAEARAPAVVPILGLYAYVGSRLLPLAQSAVRVYGEIVAATAPLGYVAQDWRAVAAARAQQDPVAEDFRFERAIELAGVGYRYPESAADVLAGIDWTIRAGECAGVVGRSGSGKTTLVLLLAGLIEPSAGTVRVDGRDVGGDGRVWRRCVGYVSQRFAAVSGSIRDNVALGVAAADVRDDAVWRALDTAELADFVRALDGGLDATVGDGGARLSGGERQRLAIARALYHDPDVLLLDEATAALDRATERTLLARLVGDRRRRTVVLVTHRTESLAVCDRIAVLAEGRMAAAGRYDELLASSDAFRVLVDGSAEAPGSALRTVVNE